MVNLKLHKNIYIKVKTDNFDFLQSLKEYFTEFKDNFFHMPKYKSGQWDGKISVFKNNCFPFGLIKDFQRFVKEYFTDEEIIYDQKILNLFNGDNLSPEYNLKFYPRPYQKDVIEKALKYNNSLFVVGTAGGKSLVLSYIFKTLYENKKITNLILIVPTINLISQFKSDMIEYGIDPSLIGEFYGEKKEQDKTIVISTWQSLQSRLDTLQYFDAVMVDEAHFCRSDVLMSILKNCDHMLYRIGCTGTLPDNRLEQLNIKSFLGPVLSYYPVKYLIENEYIADCKIKVYDINYNKALKGNYNEIKDEIFSNKFRLSLLERIVKNTNDENILLLVSRIEKEGKILENHLNSIDELKNRQIKFIYGKTKPAEREEWRQKAINEKGIVLVAGYPLLQQGVNIEGLKHIVFASTSKAKIRVLQSIGRGLRKSGDTSAIIYDFLDGNHKIFQNHFKERLKFYEDEDFDIEYINIKES